MMTLIAEAFIFALPTHGRPSLIYHLEEERPAGTVVVADLARDANLTSRYSIGVLRMLSYVIVTQSGHRGLFRLEEKSGRLRTSSAIDRDVICSGQSSDCVIELDVAVLPEKYYELIRVDIVVLDINDNAPTFGQRKLTLTISESTPAPKPQLFPIIPASDADCGLNGVVSYRLISPTTQFGLEIGIVSGDLHLSLRERLDRELESQYELKLLAYDAGSPSRTGTLLIEIRVADVNDNSPTFERPSYKVSISQEFPNGSTIVQVHASDPDEGVNRRIHYRLSQSTEALYGDLFHMDPRTGCINLIQPVSSLKQATFELDVVAEDEGEDSVPTTTSVLITILGDNECRPVITIKNIYDDDDDLTSNDTGSVQVDEGDLFGDVVAWIAATDADDGENGQVVTSYILIWRVVFQDF